MWIFRTDRAIRPGSGEGRELDSMQPDRRGGVWRAPDLVKCGFEAPPVKRRHRLVVRLSDDELAQLDELRPRGVARAVFVRQLLREPMPVDVATREEALSLLTSLARDRSVTAAVALERALRDDDVPKDPWDLLGVEPRR